MSIKSSLWNVIFVLNKINTILLEVSHILFVLSAWELNCGEHSTIFPLSYTPSPDFVFLKSALHGCYIIRICGTSFEHKLSCCPTVCS